ncbi:MAG TPA: gamma subclass chorismate mutase AroQ [Burkholderiales bacterium]|jgi:chorismate mutase|nr:gamma subclass chorismate mutase AroQ [Burkholderiales bacterium]
MTSTHQAIVRTWLSGAALALLLTACASQQPRPQTDPDGAKVDRVLMLTAQRLAIANEVAKAKWNTHSPVTDAARERRILAALTKQAQRRGIDPDFARRYFESQIEASKMVQHARFSEWAADGRGKFRDAPDLRRDIRPALDRLTPQILDALAQALPVIRKPGGQRMVLEHAQTVLLANGGEAAAWQVAVQPLAAAAAK